MSYTVKTWRDPYGNGYSTTTKRFVELKPGLTVLVGCNGAGKTTLLQNIQKQLNDEKIPQIMFNNLSEGRDSIGKMIFENNISLAALLLNSSEGEQIVLNVTEVFRRLAYSSFLKTGIVSKGRRSDAIQNVFKKYQEEVENPVSDKRFLLFDATDSGLSIDNVLDLKDAFSMLFESAEKEKVELYIIISANEYEMAAGEQCLDVMSGKYVTFKTYQSFRKFILKSREKKEKRMEKAEEKKQKK